MRLRLPLSWSSFSLLAVVLAGSVAAATPARSAEATIELQDALVTVAVNGAAAGEPVVLLRDAAGRFFANAEMLTAWRLKIGAPAFVRGGIAYFRLNGTSGLELAFDDAKQSLSIIADPGLIERTRLSYAHVDLDDRVVSGTGAFFNYDVTGQLAGGEKTLAGAFEAGAFTRYGVGTTGFVGRLSGGAVDLVRLDTHWTFDDPTGLRSLRVGDSITGGGVGGSPLRFAGVQLARNFGTRPDFVTIPLPSLRGSAAVPSIVDLYVNDVLRSSRDVPAGPFDITDVPIVTGSGDVRLVVRDLLGREQIVSQSYYTSPRLLRQGLHDYSYEAGFLRRSFGLKSNDYGAPMLSATHRYGFSDNLTGEGHAEVTRDTQSAGLAMSIVLAGIAQIETSVAGSRSELGKGSFAGLTVERKTAALSLGVRAEVTSKNYMTVGMDRERRPAASTIQAFAGVPLGFGSLGLSYLRRNSRDTADVEFVSANASLRVGRLGSLHLAGRKDLNRDKDFAGEMSFSMPLGPRTSLSAGASLDDGFPIVKAMLQRNLPVGEGVGYQLAASAGGINRVTGKLMLRTGIGDHEGELTWTDGKTGMRLSTAGGFGLVEGKGFASRQLTGSFATVKVGDYQNVRVYADNHLVGRTDKAGIAVVPTLRPFDRNKLRIELSDLPMDAEVGSDVITVRPQNRHGVAVKFDAAPARGAVITVLRDDGSPLPPGSAVRLDGSSEEAVSAPGGDVYLAGLGVKNRGVATWSSGRCRFLFDYAGSKEPQPRLGNVQCRTILQ